MVAPRRAAGSAGGGPSTDNEMTCAPRMMVSPIARLSSVSVTCCVAPGAAFPFRRVRRNSSVSARTRFMCYEEAVSTAILWRVCDTNLVEGEHLPDHLSAILKRDFHAVVDLHWVSLCGFGRVLKRLLDFAISGVVSQFLCASSLRSRLELQADYLPSFPVGLRRQTWLYLRVRGRLELRKGCRNVLSREPLSRQ